MASLYSTPGYQNYAPVTSTPTSQAGKGLDLPNSRLAPADYPSGNAPDANTRSFLGRLLGNTWRGQGPDNGATSGGVRAPAPRVEIAPPATRVPVPMPTAPQGVQGELGDWALPGYLSPQEHIAQVPLVGVRQPAGSMTTPDIAVAGPQPYNSPNFYAPSSNRELNPRDNRESRNANPLRRG